MGLMASGLINAKQKLWKVEKGKVDFSKKRIWGEHSRMSRNDIASFLLGWSKSNCGFRQLLLMPKTTITCTSLIFAYICRGNYMKYQQTIRGINV